jgi:hypothetical protein
MIFLINSTLLNILSILFSTSGAIIIYLFTPKINTQNYVFNKSEKYLRMREDGIKNLRLKQGFILIMIGIVIQIFALFK